MKEKDLKNSAIIYDELLILLEDKSAAEMCTLFFKISQLFDDIYDEGKLEKTEVVELMYMTMVDLPQNGFYNTFQYRLQPLVESFILQWMSANNLEDKKEQLEKSYMLRAFLFQIFHFSAMVLKGRDFAIKNSDFFQKLYGETFNEYVKEFSNG